MSRVLPYNAKQWEIPLLLDGRRTVTRRAIKNLYIEEKSGMITLYEKNEDDAFYVSPVEYAKKEMLTYSPYQPGDIIYVREAFCPNYFDESIAGYRSDGLRGNRNAYKADYHKNVVGDVVPEPKWTPSIHMPKEVARIWLKVKDVRVERLQDITPDQVVAEGITGLNLEQLELMQGHCDIPFAFLWDSTIQKKVFEKYRWAANPWVWVIEFERCEKPESEG